MSGLGGEDSFQLGMFVYIPPQPNLLPNGEGTMDFWCRVTLEPKLSHRFDRNLSQRQRQSRISLYRVLQR